MKSEPTVLVTICARGGSKGVPGKNIREVGGKPLLVHSIEHAQDWNRTTDLVVSTDSDKIADVASADGAAVPFERPAHLASADAAKFPVIQHATEQMEDETGRSYDYVVDLDATAPLRLTSDIEACFQQIHGTDARNAYTVCPARKNPYFNMVELDDDGYASLSKDLPTDIVRRQDAPTVYEVNASVYAYERSYLRTSNSITGDRTRVAEMPPERSVDIDRPIDLAWVEFLMERPEVWQ